MDALRAALDGHLLRLTVWSVLSLVVGLALVRRDRGFGIMTVGWALVNLAIVVGSRLGSGPGPLGPFREFLAFNLGLNFGYIGVGVALAVVGRGLARGAGVAVAVQGAALLVLDGVLWRMLPSAG